MPDHPDARWRTFPWIPLTAGLLSTMPPLQSEPVGSRLLESVSGGLSITTWDSLTVVNVKDPRPPEEETPSASSNDQVETPGKDDGR